VATTVSGADLARRVRLRRRRWPRPGLDFADRIDRFEILGGADRFRDLEITQRGEDVLIAFAETQIVLADAEIAELGARDFLF
jgi:hypothetical protein